MSDSRHANLGMYSGFIQLYIEKNSVDLDQKMDVDLNRVFSDTEKSISIEDEKNGFYATPHVKGVNDKRKEHIDKLDEIINQLAMKKSLDSNDMQTVISAIRTVANPVIEDLTKNKDKINPPLSDKDINYITLNYVFSVLTKTAKSNLLVDSYRNTQELVNQLAIATISSEPGSEKNQLVQNLANKLTNSTPQKAIKFLDVFGEAIFIEALKISYKDQQTSLLSQLNLNVNEPKQANLYKIISGVESSLNIEAPRKVENPLPKATEQAKSKSLFKNIKIKTSIPNIFQNGTISKYTQQASLFFNKPKAAKKTTSKIVSQELSETQKTALQEKIEALSKTSTGYGTNDSLIKADIIDLLKDKQNGMNYTSQLIEQVRRDPNLANNKLGDDFWLHGVAAISPAHARVVYDANSDAKSPVRLVGKNANNVHQLEELASIPDNKPKSIKDKVLDTVVETLRPKR